ncbi:hypothetical protein T459_16704 [Capsicum annuum]|uniref:Uncharacterized protein n=1 Tax=Capsicum annuum TaxID=4072 RepID=A0A2G2Z9G2_CAPAN|nr:hypothetical protein T459_16704 [Capsicum annuum]
MWNIAAVIPVDKRIGSGSGGGGSNDSSSETGENLYDLVLADIRFLTQKRKINNLPVGYRVMQQPPVPAAGQPHLDPMGMSSCHVVNGVPAQETIIL